jgi:hypothetical protein
LVYAKKPQAASHQSTAGRARGERRISRRLNPGNADSAEAVDRPIALNFFTRRNEFEQSIPSAPRIQALTAAALRLP